MHGRLIEKISWSTCGRHVTLWHRSAFENRIVTTNSSMIKRPFLSAFGYHSDKIGRYSFTLRGRLRFEVARGYARSHKRGRAWILNILKVTCSFFSPPCLYLTTNAHSHCSPVVSNRWASSLGNVSPDCSVKLDTLFYRNDQKGLLIPDWKINLFNWAMYPLLATLCNNLPTWLWLTVNPLSSLLLFGNSGIKWN